MRALVFDLPRLPMYCNSVAAASAEVIHLVVILDVVCQIILSVSLVHDFRDFSPSRDFFTYELPNEVYLVTDPYKFLHLWSFSVSCVLGAVWSTARARS